MKPRIEEYGNFLAEGFYKFTIALGYKAHNFRSFT